MKDTEVGERWRESLDCRKWPYGTIGADIVQSLIRKLVEDRQTLWWHQLAKREGGTNPQEALRYALRDFGIDPATWEQKHEG